MRKITHKDIVLLNDGRYGMVMDTRYENLHVRLDGYPYKSMSHFHNISESQIKEVRECFPCSEFPSEWVVNNPYKK